MAFLALSSLLSDITVQVGKHVWDISSSLIVYVIIAAIVGFVAELIVGWRLPFGVIGAVVVGLIGVWLVTQVIIINGIPDFSIDNVQIIHALIGALVLIVIWHIITYPFWRGRRRTRYYR